MVKQQAKRVSDGSSPEVPSAWACDRQKTKTNPIDLWPRRRFVFQHLLYHCHLTRPRSRRGPECLFLVTGRMAQAGLGYEAPLALTQESIHVHIVLRDKSQPYPICQHNTTVRRPCRVRRLGRMRQGRRTMGNYLGNKNVQFVQVFSSFSRPRNGARHSLPPPRRLRLLSYTAETETSALCAGSARP